MSNELFMRMCTALPLIGGSIGAVFYLDFKSFLILETMLILLAAWEWSYLCGYVDKGFRFGFVCLVGLGCYAIQFVEYAWIASLSIILSSGLVGHIGILLRKQKRPLYPPFGLAIIGVFYLCMTWYVLAYLKRLPAILGLGLVLITLTDSLAYLVGRCFGRHALAPSISPNKTYEGLLGGVIGPTCVLVLVLMVSGKVDCVKSDYLLLGIMTSLIAQAGDLFESAIKRQRHLKDSGQWLPGHGGILDRLDSIMTALPFFAACVYFVALTI